MPAADPRLALAGSVDGSSRAGRPRGIQEGMALAAGDGRRSTRWPLGGAIPSRTRMACANDRLVKAHRSHLAFAVLTRNRCAAPSALTSLRGRDGKAVLAAVDVHADVDSAGSGLDSRSPVATGIRVEGGGSVTAAAPDRPSAGTAHRPASSLLEEMVAEGTKCLGAQVGAVADGDIGHPTPRSGRPRRCPHRW